MPAKERQRPLPLTVAHRLGRPDQAWSPVIVMSCRRRDTIEASPRDKLIVPNAEVAIRSFREADRPQLERLWSEVFPDDPPRSAPGRMIEGALAVRPESLLVADLGGAVVGAVLAGFYRALGDRVEERLSMGRAVD